MPSEKTSDDDSVSDEDIIRIAHDSRLTPWGMGSRREDAIAFARAVLAFARQPRAKPIKPADRARRWVRVCAYVDKEAHYAKKQGTKVGYAETLIDFCSEEHAKATAEGFHDTATYLQHVIDDMHAFKQLMKKS